MGEQQLQAPEAATLTRVQTGCGEFLRFNPYLRAARTALANP
jgi:hypothetical protein